MTRPPRPSAKAVITGGGRVLLLHLREESAGDFYELPGGGIHPGESLGDAARREVGEETGYPVEVGELLWVRDFIAAHHPHAHLHAPGHHGVEFMFRATVIGPAGAPVELDNHQLGVEWVDSDRLSLIVVSPRMLAARLVAFLTDEETGPVYWGDVS